MSRIAEGERLIANIKLVIKSLTSFQFQFFPQGELEDDFHHPLQRTQNSARI